MRGVLTIKNTPLKVHDATKRSNFHCVRKIYSPKHQHPETTTHSGRTCAVQILRLFPLVIFTTNPEPHKPNLSSEPAKDQIDLAKLLVSLRPVPLWKCGRWAITAIIAHPHLY